MFWRKKKEEVNHKRITLDVNEHNSIWALNEELKRLYELYGYEVKTNQTKNFPVTWQVINQFQQALLGVVAKHADPDIQKSILEIQSHLADDIILKGKDAGS